MRYFIPTSSLWLAVSVLGAAQAIAQAAPTHYVVTDLGDLGGVESVATSINASGQIVGVSYLAGHTLNNTCDERRAFLYVDGAMTELASLPGTRSASVSAISDRGDVSGTNDVYVAGNCSDPCFAGFCDIQTPVLVRGGVAIDLLTSSSPWNTGVANDVNDSGQVVGWSRNEDLPNNTWHAWLWENGALTDLGTLDMGWSIATAINDQGLVVGYSQIAPGTGGFRWSESDGPMTQLPVLDTYTNNGANDVNASGEVAGWSGPSLNMARPVLYPASGGVVDLGSLGGTDGSAYALNDRGSVVGYSYTGSQSRHAFLYRDGSLRDLNEWIAPGSGWELIEATDVNDVGSIVGWGCKNSTVTPSRSCLEANGTETFRRAFLLTPMGSLDDLEDLIRSFDLPHGLETSLLAKLDAARRALEAGRTKTGCNLLGSLANEVEAQSGSGLTTDQADLLLQAVGLLQSDYGCA